MANINLILIIILTISFLTILYLINKHNRAYAAVEQKQEDTQHIVHKYMANNISSSGLNDNVLNKHVAFISIAAGGGAGLCNQIMALAQGIFTAIDDSKKLIVVDSFNNQITSVGKSIPVNLAIS